MDRQWWETHLDEVNRLFRGARYTINTLPPKFQTTRLSASNFETYGNSGASCISLAAAGGASRILLLGFDCQKTGGKSHWHGDHPPNLGNAAQIDRWHERFNQQAQDLAKIKIINCSRETALRCWPRADLGDMLC